MHDRPTGCLPAKGIAKAREAAAGLCGAEGLSAGHAKLFDVRGLLKDFPPNRKGGVRCDDLLRQNGADTARLAASSRLCKVLFAGDGAGEAATQLESTAQLGRMDTKDHVTTRTDPAAKWRKVQEAGFAEIKRVNSAPGGV